MPDPNLDAFNASPDTEAERALLACCAAPGWAHRVASKRPYASVDELLETAESELNDTDLDAAMAGHPRIGDRSATGASAREQRGVADAGDDVRVALAVGNAAYEERFGHVYLVCASGRSAADLLSTLNARLGNDPATERRVALGELAAINRIRLRNLVGSP
ncbi:2-oxo-4-hydroxy-4-carboxy-5-ureidoimidazoline decarboxylase [Pseudonocardia sp. TRM90224]|uniref:2-oxo-4-hydroxy-4-carboxy-5-ureidoimidazoline decarboxylase n=1 Tax=Pseudonocardia sp. TRM90224 TaxID=2812678 RepID=UPI001E538B81|nr:2-oxo-4-hydroxy-4-carboxy-5-ureidoimidazoline decarboxylase [Pseudonocardia sp. TRM90224]